MHAHPRQIDRRTNVKAIARRFVLTKASRAKKRESDYEPTTTANLLEEMHLYSQKRDRDVSKLT